MRRIWLLFLLALSAACVAQTTELLNRHEVIAGDVLVKYKPECEVIALENHKRQHNIDREHKAGDVPGLHHMHSRTKSTQQLLDELRKDSCVVYAAPNAKHAVIPQGLPNDPSFSLQWWLNNTGQTGVPFANGVSSTCCMVSCSSGSSCSQNNGAIPGTNNATSGADIFGGHASAAWALSTGSTTYAMAVLGFGTDCSLPELSANCWSAPSSYTLTINGSSQTCPSGSHGYSTTTLSCNPAGDYNAEGAVFVHDTMTAGVMAAVSNNSAGVASENWNASLVAIRGAGGTTQNLLDGFSTAVQLKQLYISSGGTNGANIRVVDASWTLGDYLDANGCPKISSGDNIQPIHDEIAALGANDILFVNSAGNYGNISACKNDDTAGIYPAAWTDLSNQIVVASSDDTDAAAFDSNYGASTVHLAAPGMAIYSTVLSGTNLYAEGTSFSAPMVAGAVPLILSVCSGLDTNGLKLNILDYVDAKSAWSGKTVTGGRLNVYNSMQGCIGDSTGPTTALTSPAAGTVSGHVTITASCSDSGSGCKQVWLYAGSTLLATANASPWTMTWNTSQVANGSYSLTSVAYDAAGNKTTSSAVSVTVNNSAATTGTNLQNVFLQGGTAQ